jgi:hypothetical protein
LVNASGHCRSAAQRPMDLDEVVREVAERNGCGVILNLLAEGVRQSRVASIGHTQREIMTLNEASRDVGGIKLADHREELAVDALTGAIAILAFGCIGVNLLAIVHSRSSFKGPLHRCQIHGDAVTGQLNSFAQSACQTIHKRPRRQAIVPGVAGT